MTTPSNIIERNKTINAIVEWSRAFVEGENSLNGGHFQAKMPENPLQDWTFAIKSNIAVAGMAHTAGIGAFRERVAKQDAFVVQRLREAGAQIIGIANMEEAALGAVTDNPHYGKTHNPLRVGYTAGGSSGGSAAAVAAGFARVALGTDTMGSSRIPAAYCGVVGVKPSFGRLSMRGVEPLSRRLDHVGIFAANVADVAACFDVLDAFDVDCGSAREYSEHVASDAKRLAVLDAPSRAGLQPAVAEAYAQALRALSKTGLTLIEKPVDQSALAKARRVGLLLCEAELANTLSAALDASDSGVSPALRKLIAFGAAQSAPKLAAAHAAIDDAVLVERVLLADVDAICWPTAPQTAFAFDSPVPSDQADFTCLANFTGAAAISLPLPRATGQLPAGLQLVVSAGRDRLLLKLAASIQAVN
ncbi:MAG: amidase [Nitrosomonadaceae bacterium]|nr:amidase [Nitrosomonadaceae bacterium]